MGMSSSQARLLHLTSRMHQIEYKAAKLEAEKLQMANKSRRVYEDYQQALEATKVQYKVLNEDASITFRDATLASLENGVVPGYKGEVSSKSYLIKSTEDNRIWVTRTFADYYGINEEDEVQDPGILEDYLTENGANTQPVKETVTDYENILSVDPIENEIVKLPSVNQIPDSPTYNFPSGGLDAPNEVKNHMTITYNSGTYIPPEAVEGTTTYNPSGTLSSVSVTPFVMEPSRVDVVTGGTPINAVIESTPAKTESSFKNITKISNVNFKPLDHMEYQIPKADLDKTISELFPDIDFNVTTDPYHPLTILHELVPHANKGFVSTQSWGRVVSSSPVEYDKDMTLGELLTIVAANDQNIVYQYNYNTNNGIIRTKDDSNQPLYFESNDNRTSDDIIASYLNNKRNFIYDSEQTLDLNTKILDLLYSNVFRDDDSTNKDPFNQCNINIRLGNNTAFWSEIPSKDATLGEYLEDLKNNAGQQYGFDYKMTGDGLEISTTSENVSALFDTHSKLYRLSSYVQETSTTTTHTININLNALAENLYLMESMKNETTYEAYNSNKDIRIQAIKGVLTRAYNTNSTDDLRKLALLGDCVKDAINDETKLETWYPRIQQLLTGNPPRAVDFSTSEYKDKYKDTSTADVEQINISTTKKTVTATKYTFKLIEPPQMTIDPDHQIVEGEPELTRKGNITAPTSDEIRQYLAYAMYEKDDSKSYIFYKNKLLTLGLTKYELAILCKNKDNEDLIQTLLNCRRKDEVKNWINTNEEEYLNTEIYLNSEYFDLSQSSSGYSVSIDTTDSTVTSSRNDTIKYLGYQMYLTYPEKTPAEWESYITGKFGQSGWNYNDKQVASISSNFAANKDDILNKLHDGNTLSPDYTEKYNGYVYIPREDSYSVGSTQSGKEEHYVTMDSPNDIAVILTRDIYERVKDDNPNLDPNTIKSKIENFGAQKLASLSYYYGKSQWESIVTALANNINNINASLVSGWTDYYNDCNDFRYSGNDYAIPLPEQTYSEQSIPGKVNIPTLDGIASNLVVAFRKAGKTINETEVLTKLRNIYSEDNKTNNQILANINDVVCQYLNGSGNQSNVENIYNHLYNSGQLNVPSNYPQDQYDIERKYLGLCDVKYGTKVVDTDRVEWVHDDKYNELVKKWNILKQLSGNLFKIIDEPLASSYELVRNLVCDSGAYLLELNKTNETTDFPEMRDTNISVETHLREVDDEKELKKAEAKYEADMRRIDFKDRQYDRELAALDAERNATKNEMETLKTVIKDNVDRTFKLFS